MKPSPDSKRVRIIGTYQNLRVRFIQETKHLDDGRVHLTVECWGGPHDGILVEDVPLADITDVEAELRTERT